MGKVPKAPGIYTITTKSGRRRIRRLADGKVRFLKGSPAKGSTKKPKKKSASRSAPRSTAPRRAKRSNPAPKGNPKRKRNTMAKNNSRRPAGAVNPEAIGFGALAGAASNMIARMLGPQLGPLAGPAAEVGAGALLPDTAGGRRVRDALQTGAGVEFGSAVSDIIGVPQVAGLFGGGGGNGQQAGARRFL